MRSAIIYSSESEELLILNRTCLFWVCDLEGLCFTALLVLTSAFVLSSIHFSPDACFEIPCLQAAATKFLFREVVITWAKPAQGFVSLIFLTKGRKRRNVDGCNWIHINLVMGSFWLRFLEGFSRSLLRVFLGNQKLVWSKEVSG
jgi:hypothetical protein